MISQIKQFFKDRKLIDFEWCKYKTQFQIGISFCLQNIEKEIEYPEYNVKHFHVWIDLGFRCLEISILNKRDYK